MKTKTIRVRKLFKKLENRKDRVHFLKGIGRIVLLSVYSFRWRGNILYLLCNGDEIHRFPRDVTVREIKKCISDYEANLRKERNEKKPNKVLKDYCKAPASICLQFKNCDECHGLHKKWAEERKEKGQKIVRPKPEDIEERTTLSPTGPKKILSRRSYSGGW